MECLNRCILTVGTPVLPPDMTNVWSAGLTQTSVSASNWSSQLAGEASESAQNNSSLSQRIAQALQEIVSQWLFEQACKPH